jgi:hypothetical protein
LDPALFGSPRKKCIFLSSYSTHHRASYQTLHGPSYPLHLAGREVFWPKRPYAQGYTWPWTARPGPKFPGQAQPDHACRPGLGQIFGPMVSMGRAWAIILRDLRKRPGLRPKARRAFLMMDRAWAKVSGPTVGRAGPGLGRDFPGQALVGPARPEKCSGILRVFGCIRA